MRTKSLAFLFSLLMLIAFPVGVSASPLTIVGSLTITGDGGAALTTELVGVAMIANPGFEKNSTIQIPPFTLPVFVDGEAEDEEGSTSKSKLLKKNFDTTVVVTNTTGASLTIELTLRDAAGALLTPTPVPMTLAAHATKVIFVSDLLP